MQSSGAPSSLPSSAISPLPARGLPATRHTRSATLAELDHAHARNALNRRSTPCDKRWGAKCCGPVVKKRWGPREEGISCDVREFETALEAGQAEQALELYRGSLFNGFHVSEVPEFERWLDEERNACADAHARGPAPHRSRRHGPEPGGGGTLGAATDGAVAVRRDGGAVPGRAAGPRGRSGGRGAGLRGIPRGASDATSSRAVSSNPRGHGRNPDAATSGASGRGKVAAGAVRGERVAAPELSLSDESRDATARRSPTARKRLPLGLTLVVVGLLASGWL